MEATRDDIEGLFELQRIDLEIKRLSKELDELPQRGIIVAARDKKTAHRGQIRAGGRAQARHYEEDHPHRRRGRVARQERGRRPGRHRRGPRRLPQRGGPHQGAGGHRSPPRHHCRGPRRSGRELDKISAMEAQISLALEEIGAKEQEAIDSFQKQGGDLKLAIAKLEAARGQVEAKVSPQLLDVYNRTSARSGVAIGVLDGNRCGACRTVIDGGRLIDLRNQAPLGMCPSCKRLLVIA